jgi:hypothetical protein
MTVVISLRGYLLLLLTVLLAIAPNPEWNQECVQRPL